MKVNLLMENFMDREKLSFLMVIIIKAILVTGTKMVKEHINIQMVTYIKEILLETKNKIKIVRFHLKKQNQIMKVE
jgi:hypothetical protein